MPYMFSLKLKKPRREIKSHILGKSVDRQTIVCEICNTATVLDPESATALNSLYATLEDEGDRDIREA